MDHRLQAAQGYAELGMFDEALAELDHLPEAAQKSEPALTMRVFVLMRSRNWKDALQACRDLCERYPLQSTGYLHGAFCLHEMDQTVEAREMLLSGPPVLLQEPTYFYNLGCYDAALGDMDQAIRHLETSFLMDDKFREIAKYDPDLKLLSSLWSAK